MFVFSSIHWSFVKMFLKFRNPALIIKLPKGSARFGARVHSVGRSPVARFFLSKSHKNEQFAQKNLKKSYFCKFLPLFMPISESLRSLMTKEGRRESLVFSEQIALSLTKNE